MRALLKERFFGQRKEAEEDATEEQDNARALFLRERRFADSEFMPEFVALIDGWLLATEPQPGTHEEMLFTAGVRKGLLQVKLFLDDIKRIKGEKDV